MNRRLWPYFVEPLRARKGAMLLTMLAIALGVALGVAVNAVNRAALEEFAHGMRTISGQADLEVRGPRAGFDETLYPRIARLAEVAAASPALEFDAKLPGKDEPVKVVGIDPFRAASLQPGLVAGLMMEDGERLRLIEGETIFLSPAAAVWLEAPPGTDLVLQSGLREVKLRVGGLLTGVGPKQRLAVVDIAAAQWRFDRLGVLHRIDLRLKSGADAAEVERAIRALLPAGVVVLRPDEAEGRQANLSRAYRVNLNMLALIALVTGAFLVFSAQSLAVVRRRAELAFLRAAGVTRTMLVAWLVVEGAAIGAIGAALGVVLGYALAQLALSALGGDLGAGFFAGSRPELVLDPLGAAAFFLLGVGAAAAGAFVPALEAAATPPALALKSGDEARSLARLNYRWPGAATLAAGGLLAWLPPVGGLPVFGYAAIALMLVGAILLMPRIAQTAFAMLPGRGSAPLLLAQAQLKSAPGHAAIAGAGILASVAVAAAMAIMVASFRVSLDGWLEQVLPESGFLTPAEQDIVRSTPGVARVDFVRHQNLLLDAARTPVALLARNLASDDPGSVVPLVAGGAPTRRDLPPVWISEAMVDLYGMRLGNQIALPLAGRTEHFIVAGIWRDYARQHGAVTMELEVYRRLTGD
ncbi:MAG: h16, partial [Proteobacteria bacterium]|nr:h16 [Pseudomonadota bacterium]